MISYTEERDRELESQGNAREGIKSQGRSLTWRYRRKIYENILLLTFIFCLFGILFIFSSFVCTCVDWGTEIIVTLQTHQNTIQTSNSISFLSFATANAKAKEKKKKKQNPLFHSMSNLFPSTGEIKWNEMQLFGWVQNKRRENEESCLCIKFILLFCIKCFLHHLTFSFSNSNVLFHGCFVFLLDLLNGLCFTQWNG